MRIWHQSFTVLQDLPGYVEGLKKRIGEVVRPGTEVVLHGQIPGTYNSNYPGVDLAYGAIYWMHGLQWIAAAREAEQQGFDAMVLASIAGPMSTEIRTIVDIPVIGYGEAAFNLAGVYGHRAGVVNRIIENGEKLVRETGADVIIPGEMPLNLLLSTAGVNKIAGATVIDGIATSFKFAEMLVDLKKLAGMGPSNHGWFHATPDRNRFEQVLDFYGLKELGKRIPSA
jgi:allantoin racemase